MKQLSEGASVVMCVTVKDSAEKIDAQKTFRDLVGPGDPVCFPEELNL